LRSRRYLRKKSRVSVMLATVPNNQTTMAMDTTEGMTMNSPVMKLARHRPNRLFFSMGRV